MAMSTACLLLLTAGCVLPLPLDTGPLPRVMSALPGGDTEVHRRDGGIYGGDSGALRVGAGGHRGDDRIQGGEARIHGGGVVIPGEHTGVYQRNNGILRGGSRIYEVDARKNKNGLWGGGEQEILNWQQPGLNRRYQQHHGHQNTQQDYNHQHQYQSEPAPETNQQQYRESTGNMSWWSPSSWMAWAGGRQGDGHSGQDYLGDGQQQGEGHHHGGGYLHGEEHQHDRGYQHGERHQHGGGHQHDIQSNMNIYLAL